MSHPQSNSASGQPEHLVYQWNPTGALRLVRPPVAQAATSPQCRKRPPTIV